MRSPAGLSIFTNEVGTALSSSHASNCFSSRMTGMRSCTPATNLLGSVIIMVQDFCGFFVFGFVHSDHRPAIVRTWPSHAPRVGLLVPPQSDTGSLLTVQQSRFRAI